MRPIHEIIIHHTASPSTWTRDDVLRAHLDRGFRDIGYHLLVFADGHTEPGRPLSQVGAHAEGRNEGSLGISLVGDFSRGPVPRPQWDAAVAAVADWCAAYHVHSSRVLGHCETKATLCPGFDPAVFRAAVKAHRRSDAP